MGHEITHGFDMTGRNYINVIFYNYFPPSQHISSFSTIRIFFTKVYCMHSTFIVSQSFLKITCGVDNVKIFKRFCTQNFAEKICFDVDSPM